MGASPKDLDIIGKQILLVREDQDILIFLQDRLNQMKFGVTILPEGLQGEVPFIKGIL